MLGIGFTAWKTAGLVAAGITTTAVVATAAVVTFQNVADSPTADATAATSPPVATPAVSAPASAPSVPEFGVVETQELRVGDCISLMTAANEASSVQRVPCDSLHDGEVVSTATRPASDIGQEGTAQGMYEGCEMARAAYTDTSVRFDLWRTTPDSPDDSYAYYVQWAPPDYPLRSAGPIHPPAADWPHPELPIVCLVFNSDGAPLESSVRGEAAAYEETHAEWLSTLPERGRCENYPSGAHTDYHYTSFGEPVACEEPHDAQIIFAGYRAKTDVALDASWDRCVYEFEQWVGVPLGVSQYEMLLPWVDVVGPGGEQGELYACRMHHPERTMVGSARDVKK